MADDEIDLRFLGEQIRRLQVDVRDLKTRSARTDADVLAISERLDAIEHLLGTLDSSTSRGFAAIGAHLALHDRELDEIKSRLGAVERGTHVHDLKLDDIRKEMTRNLEITLAAINGLRGT